MSTYTPKFSISSAWRTSIENICSQLKKIKFVIDTTFTWGDFNPQTNFFGMATSAYTIQRARYVKIWKFMWFSVDLNVTVAAPLIFIITFTLPDNAIIAGPSTSAQSGGAAITDAGGFTPGVWSGIGGQGVIAFLKPALANYAAGAVLLRANGFVEIV